MAVNNSISKYDWQYILTGFFLISVFILTDLIEVVDKEYFYFVPKLIGDQPYRVFTSTLIHADLNHLLSNIGGVYAYLGIYADLSIIDFSLTVNFRNNKNTLHMMFEKEGLSNLYKTCSMQFG